MGTTIVVALISVGGVALSALVGGLGHLLARKSEKDDDVRQWVALQFARQDAEIERLGRKVDVLSTELEVEREGRRTERRRVYGLAGYVRELEAWIALHVPALSPPPATGLAREVLDNG